MKITTYACTENTFDTATSIITERIISKQLELEREKRCTRRLLQHQGRMPKKIDDVIVERILEKEDELKNKKLPSITSSNATDFMNVKSVKFVEQDNSTMKGNEENQGTASNRMESVKPLKKATINVKDIANANRKIPQAKASIPKMLVKARETGDAKNNALSKCSKLHKSLPNLTSDAMKKSTTNLKPTKIPKIVTLPKFILSSRPAGRVPVAHFGTQDDIKSEQCSACTQIIPESDNFSVQTNITNETRDVSVQAEQEIGVNTEGTNTLPKINFSRYTSTVNQPDVVQQTQMMEYMTGNDLYCLEWVRDYLFDINFDHRQIIVDDKLKEVSEVATRTSLI
ncbi:unnamed protein product [Callosobruchus maculatus]|uniref:Uncharacterized protein n=1 Tax=Callosobruchus maculatus TaxID=64391 RepID=A0A653DCA4_CALMS|nr:unnamed protein product [Callosobruchus maculatus]